MKITNNKTDVFQKFFLNVLHINISYNNNLQ